MSDSRPESIDVLAVGAHPDDAEIGCGGLLCIAKTWEFTTGILDLTKGEAASRGTPEQRANETAAAAEILGLAYRESLGLRDTELMDSVLAASEIAAIIRNLRPRVILAPLPDDPHPDHVAAGQLVRRAAFLARIKSRGSGQPHAAGLLLYYPLQRYQDPTLALDITEVYETKRNAIEAHRSQFSKTAAELGIIPVGIGDYLWHLESRARFYGSLCGGKFGEVYVSPVPLVTSDLRSLRN